MLKMITKVKIPKGDGSEVYKDFPTDRLDFKRAKPGDKDEEKDDVSEDIKKILD